MKKVLEVERIVSCEILEPTNPVELIPHQYIPRDFRITFSHLSDDKQNTWTTSLRVRTVNDKIPRAIEVLIIGNSSDDQGATLKYQGRVDRDHLLYVAQEIRHLEAIAAVECIKRFSFDPELEVWREFAGVLGLEEEYKPKVLSELDANKLRRVVEERNAKKLTPEFLREVASVFLKARDEKKRTNVAVKKYFDEKDGIDHPIKTVRNWISRAQVYIPPKKIVEKAPPKAT